MTITLHLPPEEEQEIKQRAASRGQDLDTYVNQLISTEIRKTPASMFEACKPFEDAVTASGMTDEEFDALIEETIHEVRVERHAREQK